MKVRLTHGSPKLLNGLQLLNYEVSRDTKTGFIFDEEKTPFSGDGNDAHGPGVYAFNGLNVEDAAGYASHNDGVNHGYAYVLDVEANGYINDLPPDYLEVDQWVDIYRAVLDGVKEIHGYDEEKLYEKQSLVESLYEEHGDDWINEPDGEYLVQEIESMLLGNVDIESEPISDYGDPCDWFDEVIMEPYRNLCDPTELMGIEIGYKSSLEEEIGRKIYQYDNFWDLLVEMSRNMAVKTSGFNITSYNELFAREVLDKAHDRDDLVIARAGEGCDFSVIFNTDGIVKTQVLDLDRKYGKKEPEASLAM